MRTYIGVIALLWSAQGVFAQTSAPNSQLSAAYSLDRLADFRGLSTGEVVLGIPLAPGKVVGDSYLSTEWKTGTILLYDKEKLIERYPIRYDIQANEIEIKASNGIKVVSGQKVKSFTWIDAADVPPDFFINARDLKLEDGSSLIGFLQVLEDGQIPLFKRTFTQLKKADYHVSMNVGSQDDKILKKEEFYILYQGKLIEAPGSRKKLLSLFGEQASAVDAFIKEEKIGVSKEEELKLIFDYYNSRVQPQ